MRPLLNGGTPGRPTIYQQFVDNFEAPKAFCPQL
jgi:hypothetical protein